MTWQDWISSLGNGAIGAVIGLVGVYVAYLLTARRSTKIEREARTAESVAAIVVAANSLPRHLASPMAFFAERAVVEFLEAGQLFATREVADHPAVSAWVLARCGAVNEIFARRKRLQLPLWLRQRTMRELGRHMGETAGMLVEWNGRLGQVPGSGVAVRRDPSGVRRSGPGAVPRGRCR